MTELHTTMTTAQSARATVGEGITVDRQRLERLAVRHLETAGAGFYVQLVDQRVVDKDEGLHADLDLRQFRQLRDGERSAVLEAAVTDEQLLQGNARCERPRRQRRIVATIVLDHHLRHRGGQRLELRRLSDHEPVLRIQEVSDGTVILEHRSVYHSDMATADTRNIHLFKRVERL